MKLLIEYENIYENEMLLIIKMDDLRKENNVIKSEYDFLKIDFTDRKNAVKYYKDLKNEMGIIKNENLNLKNKIGYLEDIAKRLKNQIYNYGLISNCGGMNLNNSICNLNTSKTCLSVIDNNKDLIDNKEYLNNIERRINKDNLENKENENHILNTNISSVNNTINSNYYSNSNISDSKIKNKKYNQSHSENKMKKDILPYSLSSKKQRQEVSQINNSPTKLTLASIPIYKSIDIIKELNEAKEENIKYKKSIQKACSMIKEDLHMEEFFDNYVCNYSIYESMKIEDKLIHFIGKVLRLVNYNSIKIDQLKENLNIEENKHKFIIHNEKIEKIEKIKPSNISDSNLNYKNNQNNENENYKNCNFDSNNYNSSNGFIQYGKKLSLPSNRNNLSNDLLSEFIIHPSDFNDFGLYQKIIQMKYKKVKSLYQEKNNL